MSDVEAHAALLHQLEPNESLVWHGRPVKGFGLVAAYISFFIMGVLAFVAATVSTIKVLSSPIQTIPAEILIATGGFLLISFIMLLGPLCCDSLLRRNTAYGLTPYRIIIISGFSGNVVHSYRLKEISIITISESSNRIGKIFFGEFPMQPIWKFQMDAFRPPNYADPHFAPISNVREVYDLLRMYHQRERII